MKRQLPFLVTHFALGLMLATSLGSQPVQAADTEAASSTSSALELLPDETLAALVVPNLSLLDAKITGLGAPLQTPIPSPLMLGRGMIGLKDGLKEDGCVVIAMVGPLSGDNDYGTPVILIPASDYSKLIAQYSPTDQGHGVSLVHIPQSPPLLVASKNSYAVFVHSGDAGRKLLDSVLQRPAGVSAAIAPLKTWLAEQDMAAFTTSSGVKVFMDRAGSRLKALGNSQGTASGRQMSATMEQMIPVVEKEVSQFGIGLRIDDDHSVRLVSHAQLLSGGELSKALSDIPPPAAMPLAGLPTGSYMFAADGSMGNALRDWAVKIAVNNLKATTEQSDSKISPDDWNKLLAASKNMQGGKSVSLVMGVPEADKSIYSRMFAITHVENSQTYLKNYESSMTTYGDILKKLNNPALPTYDVDKSELDGQSVLEVTVDMSGVFNQMQQNGAPASAGMGQMLFGNDGKMTTRLMAADANTIVMSWGAENLKAALEAVKSPNTSLGADVDIKATVDLMPKNAQWRAFISPTGYLEFVRNMMQRIMPQMPFQLPAFPNTPAIGLSAQLAPEAADFELLVSAAVMNGIGTYTQQLQRHGP
jgi:hypothetical protein